MPLRRKQLEVEDFEYVEAVCVEGFSTFRADPVRRGQVYSRSHWLVQKHPEYFRLLGPRPDAQPLPDKSST